MMLQPGLDLSRYITANTLSIHFYGRRMRKRLVEKEGGVPHPHSLIGQLIAKHAIDPAAAPLPPAAPAPAAAAAPAPDAAPAPERLAPADRAGRGVLNLTDLADRHGSDRGHLKHRYSELYNLLFQPLRGRAIGFVEVGPQVLDRAAPGQGPDLPSIRMWLEWFTRARIFGLSTQATPDIDEPRFAALRAEDGGGQALAAALPADLRPDIVLYAAPAASHLQQEAFLGLFPRLAAGGIFVIEGLRWQPADLEREGTKTAALFQSYLETGVFRHSDDATAAAMNALRPDISGCFVFQAKYVKTNRDQLLVVHKR
jgi:hypothetical protein